ncbi:FMN-binding negative transcriptional regulator [Sphingobacterium composti Ten et al. 2007 non Yoo et al. 2007]|uniref:FMN-binding negative transcriptional regulator n=1 Tax=Sphingobacterium composti TaxID=363260 RepID=UPI0013585B3B|nr:FMN-binding negative transcriptional regulator [Sphingobacterium composti Ten et al. 2007 non Yoo et al. 2007]
MYIPKINKVEDRGEILSFMKRFSFATIITSKNNYPVATHLPFVVEERRDDIFLISHFAKANPHWEDIEENEVLVIFTEPHAYISTDNYEKETNVPTWNYMAIHTYGKGKIVSDDKKYDAVKAMILSFDSSYQKQWENLAIDYKEKMMNGIVAFEIEVTNIEAKFKLSQNRSIREKQNIIQSLSNSNNTSENLIADYMRNQK